MDISRIQIAIIGCGRLAKELIETFYDLGVLKIICDTNNNDLSWYKKHFDNLQTNTSYDEILDDNSITGVVIAHPFENHGDIARKALLARKHVYLCRPLVIVDKTKKELLSLAKKQKRIVMIGKNLHNYPVFPLLKEMVSSGELGTLKYIHANRLSTGTIKEDENILWSFSPQDISLIIGLAGQMPEFVAATGANFYHSNMADLTSSFMHFPTGLRAHIFVSWLHSEKEHKLVVVGDKKIAVFQDQKTPIQKLHIYPHQISWDTNIPVPQKSKAEIINIYPNELLKEDCDNFLQIINGQRDYADNGNEGKQVLDVLNASQLSINQDGKKIYLAQTLGKEKGYATSPIFDPPQMEDRIGKIITLVDVKNSPRLEKHMVNNPFQKSIPPNSHKTEMSFLPFQRLTQDGKGCRINNNISIYKDLILESELFNPSSQSFSATTQHFLANDPKKVQLTIIKKGATLGANCTIARGKTIGEYAYVGAGAVVLEDVPAHALVVGNPAKIKGWLCRCGNRLRFSRDNKSSCASCLFRYIVEEDDILFVSDSGKDFGHQMISHRYVNVP